MHMVHLQLVRPPDFDICVFSCIAGGWDRVKIREFEAMPFEIVDAFVCFCVILF